MSTLTDRKEVHSAGLPSDGALYHFASLDSTNAFALKLLSIARPKPRTIVQADYQTAGRGQMGNHWHSAPCLNLCMSSITYPDLPVQDQFCLNMAISLAVRETICAYIDPEIVRVKWPNDIYVKDSKVAGILIQNTIQGNVITGTVAGVGVNVLETGFPDFLPNATSIMLQISGLPPSVTEVRDRCIDTLMQRLRQLEIARESLREEYHDVMFRRHLPSKFRLQNGTLKAGVIEGVDTQGHLVVYWDDGSQVSYKHREVELIL